MKKNGFTMIELLAIIILIGIVGLILVPSISDIIDKSNKKVFESSSDGYIKAVKTDHSSRGGISNTYIIKDGDLYHEETNEKLEIQNNSHENGILTIDSDSNVNGNINDEEYCVLVNNSIKHYGDDPTKCSIYKEELLNGTDPVLYSKMVPVTIENDGTVKTANLAKAWYNYDEELWANAVLVSNSNYINVAPNTVVKEEDIVGYFVWIPRYKYFIPTGGTSTPSSINIVFENKDTKKSFGNAVDEYYSHPGFTFGDEELNGMWVAKFETTGTGDAPTVLPNVTSLRNQNIATQFETAKKFNNYVSSADAHMMKNSEWGAVAYLSHSEYGINEQIRLNNNSGYLTGCGANEENAGHSSGCQIIYGSNITVYPQSTTKNITGIFDMAGGSSDRVMGNYNGIIETSDFKNMPDNKFYDLYKNTNYSIACKDKNCIGHSLLETKSWYMDGNGNMSNSNSWVIRGGDFNSPTSSGIFNYYSSSGLSWNAHAFRVAITK